MQCSMGWLWLVRQGCSPVPTEISTTLITWFISCQLLVPYSS
jgi:hypothetical protein